MDAANPVTAPDHDIMNRRRTSPDIGAYEAHEALDVDRPAMADPGPDLTPLLTISTIALVLLPSLLLGRHRRDPEAVERRTGTGAIDA